jgi:hypothetical protein
VITVLAAFLSCDNDSNRNLSRVINPGDEPVNPLDLTPRENAEAEWIALWLSGELVAPESLYVKVLDSRTKLLEQYIDSIPEVAIEFDYPVFKSDIRLYFSDSAKSLIRSGDYHVWDSLNNYFKVVEIDTIAFSSLYSARLSFSGRLNPSILCSEYISLPGVSKIYPEYSLIGDRPGMYPWIIDNYMTFLVRDAWGDCPSGCAQSHLFYFKESDDGIDFIGDWYRPPDDEPAWWEEAKIAWYEYAMYHSNFCSDTL